MTSSTTNVISRTRAADGGRALRRGTVLGLVAVLVSVALSACGLAVLHPASMSSPV
jgi:hypothetical protein